MMVAYRFLNNPIVMNGGINHLIIESKPLLRKTVTALLGGSGEEWFVVSEDFIPLDFNKKVYIISDLLLCDITEKRIMTKINVDIERTANEYFYEEITTIKGLLYSVAEKISYEYDYDFSYSDELETSALIKLLGFRVRNDCEKSIETIVLITKLLKKYMGVKLFICFNMNLYYTNGEIDELNETLEAMEVYILNIENSTFQSTDNNRIFIIDKDLCEVIDNE